MAKRGRPAKGRKQTTIWMSDKTRKKLGQVKRRIEADMGKDVTRPDALEIMVEAGHRAIMDGAHEFSPQKREKHARLIAAAPDMLAALQDIVNSVAPGEGTAPILKRAFAAIDKATSKGD